MQGGSVDGDSMLRGMIAQQNEVNRVLSPGVSGVERINNFPGRTGMSGFDEGSPSENVHTVTSGGYELAINEEQQQRFRASTYMLPERGSHAGMNNIIEEDNSLHDEETLSRA